jgi:two-component system, OmpR family, alkaline phosphatase synthesis response regulator PhoP
MKAKILLIEDEAHIAEGIKVNLNLSGYDVIVAKDGMIGLDFWEKEKPDLIILDIMIPKIDGLSLLKQIRKTDLDTPILVLSAKDRVEDRIEGLSYKADDYISKPFHLKELLLRIDALLKRAIRKTDQLSETVVTFGSNIVNMDTLKAQSFESNFFLTEQEGKLFHYMVNREGRFIAREELLRDVWKYQGEVNSRTVDIFISRFRKYFETNPKTPQFFHSKRIKGYMFQR